MHRNYWHLISFFALKAKQNKKHSIYDKILSIISLHVTSSLVKLITIKVKTNEQFNNSTMHHVRELSVK